MDDEEVDVLAQRVTGTRLVAGAAVPVVDRLEKRTHGRRVEYAYVRGLCGRVAVMTMTFVGERGAREAYDRDAPTGGP